MTQQTFRFKYTVGNAPAFINRKKSDGSAVWLFVNVKGDCEENARRNAIVLLNKSKIYPKQLELVGIIDTPDEE